MIDLIKLSIAGINVIPTVLLLIVLLFWLITIVGAIDIDGLDIDLDLEAEGIGADILTFLKIGDIPMSVYMSILFLIFWILNMSISIISGSWGGVPNIIGVVPCFVVAALITRIVTIPLKFMLKGLNGNSEVSREYIGETGQLRFEMKSNVVCQCVLENGTIINCIGKEGLELPSGSTVVVVERNDKNIYIVEPSIK